MSTPIQRHTVIFILRVWAEYLSGQPPGWCGVLEIVSNGQKMSFTDLDEMVEWIRKQTIEEFKTEGEP